MNQTDRFNQILDECLDRLLKGATVEQCLHDYPDQAGELEPLLRTALAAKIISTIQPRPEFKAKARYEFQSALRDMENKTRQRRPFFSWQWQWRSSWAVALVAALVVVIGGGSTIAAAGNSMPDNTLYPVKLAAEQVQLAITSSDLDKTELNARFADRRADEMVYMASKGNVQQVEIAIERLNTNLANMTKLAGNEISPVTDFSIGNTPSNAANEPAALMVAPETPSPTESPITAAPTIISAPAATDPTVTVDNTTARNAQDASRSIGKSPDSRNIANNNKALSAKYERMKQIISTYYDKRQERLKEALKVAPSEVQPAIRRAIDQSQAEHNKAIQNLDNSQQVMNQDYHN